YLALVVCDEDDLLMTDNERRFKSAIDYWTPERIANAKSALLPLFQNNSDLSQSNQLTSDEPPSFVKSVLPIQSPDQLLKDTIVAPNTVGKLYIQLSGNNYVCTASVLVSGTKDLLVTRGQCVYDHERGGWARNVIFIPGYRSGSAPFGRWSARSLITFNMWIEKADRNANIGLILLSTLSNRHIQDVVGGQGYLIDAQLQAPVYLFGYSSDINSGETLRYCSGTSQKSTHYPGFKGITLPCSIDNAGFGGPVIQRYDISTTLGYQTSVYISRSTGYVHAAVFDSNFKKMYDMYNNQLYAGSNEIFYDHRASSGSILQVSAAQVMFLIVFVCYFRAIWQTLQNHSSIN
ncbi:unnamed protein product, partial [Didymodactylos carnosus]